MRPQKTQPLQTNRRAGLGNERRREQVGEEGLFFWLKNNEQNECRWRRQMVSFVMGSPGLPWCLMGNGYYSAEPRA